MALVASLPRPSTFISGLPRTALLMLFTIVGLAGAVPAMALSTVAPPPPAQARQLPPPPPPVRILSPDAREPVRVQQATVRAEIVGLSVATRIELTLFNPNPTLLSGELQFPLAEGQSVSGFALDVDGRLREAVPVEKAKGRQVFEDITRRRVDPGLLEATQGNFHKLRVYPLPAGGTRRVVLELRESVAPGNPPVWRLPLRFGEAVGRLDVSVRAAQLAPRAIEASLGADRLEVRPLDSGSQIDFGRSNYRGRAELRITLPASPRQVLTSTESFDGSRYFVAEIPVPASTWARKAPGKVALIWDASGSGATRDHGRELALLDAYFRQLGDVEVQLVVVRNEAEPPRPFPIRRGDWEALRRVLEAMVYDGATRTDAMTPPDGTDLALLFTDGIGNWGQRKLGFANVPTFVFTASSGASPAGMRWQTELVGGGVVDLLSVPTAQAVRMLTQERARITALRGEGLSELESASFYPDAGRLVVAGVMDAPRGTLKLTLSSPNGRETTREFVVDSPRPGDAAKEAPIAVAAHRWAAMRLSRLAANEDRELGEIRALGKKFRVPTRETSLIVLESLADYVRHDIEPPAELRDAWAQQRQQKQATSNAQRERAMADLVKRFESMVRWWEQTYPKDPAPPVKVVASTAGAVSEEARPAERRADAAEQARRRAEAERQAESRSRSSSSDVAPPPPPMPVAPAPAMVAPAAPAAPAPVAARSPGQPRGDDGATATAAATITLRPWQPDEPYARRLRAAKPEEMYAIYLDERRGYPNSSAFFLDVADLLVERGQIDLGVRVLSNLAEMDLENRHLLRILGYRLLLAGRPLDAVPVLAEVMRLAPDEPQSWRDLGQAWAQAGEPDLAVHHLMEVVLRPWDGRFPDVDLIALNELNAIAARAEAAGHPVNLSRLDPRLRRVLPLDLRVALTWDADNTDIDLWVIDPNGEAAYFAHPLTLQGGLMSRDFTRGFGPEVFSLRDAKPGTYTVQARFYGHTQQVVAPATTLMARLSTGFGTAGQQDRDLVVRLSGRGDMVTIGTFTVPPKAP